jgi:carbonic anhydrase/acetyltransferase-like protein (isoleucine patch superfamily)
MNKLTMVLAGAGGFAAAALLGLLVVLAIAAGKSGREVLQLETEVEQLKTRLATVPVEDGRGHGRPNVLTTFNPDLNSPHLDGTTFIDPLASVIGDVTLGADVYVAPFASIRGDEGQPIVLGNQTNVQDGVVIHALETTQAGMPLPNRTYQVNGKEYAVYIGERVSLAHQSQVHGPARVDDGVFIGMQALVFKSSVGAGSVIEPGAKLIGVNIPAGRYVPAGSVITDQAVADKLPLITPQYPFAQLNDAVVHVNTSFARGYSAGAESAGADSGGHEGPAKEVKEAKIAAAAEHPKPEKH